MSRVRRAARPGLLGGARHRAAQAATENGHGGNAYLQPVIMAVIVLVALVLIWSHPVMQRSITLWFARPALVVLTVIQSTTMVFRLVRRHRCTV